MLVLSRLREEAIVIGDDVEVRVLEIRGDRVRLGILAPQSVSIFRKEVYLEIQKQNLEASRASSSEIRDALDLLGPDSPPRSRKKPDLPSEKLPE